MEREKHPFTVRDLEENPAAAAAAAVGAAYIHEEGPGFSTESLWFSEERRRKDSGEEAKLGLYSCWNEEREE